MRPVAPTSPGWKVRCRREGDGDGYIIRFWISETTESRGGLLTEKGDSVMFAGVIFVLGVTVLAGCGGSKGGGDKNLVEDREAEIRDLNENKVTLDPPPGVYSYKPWIRMKKQQTDSGSGTLKTKAPGKAEFSTANLCSLSAPYVATDSFENCVEVERTGQLVYFLYASDAKSDETAVDYTINLSTNNLTGNVLSGAGKEPETVEFSEVQSYCKYSSDGLRLNVSIQLASDRRLTDQKYAYLLFSIKDPAAGVRQIYTKENEAKVSLVIKPRSDDHQHPGYDSFTDYSTKPLFREDPIISVSPSIERDTSGSSGITLAAVAPKCELTMETAGRGAVNKGTVKCSNLTYGRSEANPLLGAYVNIQGNWQCDKYFRY